MKLILKEDIEDELNIEPESNEEEVNIEAPLDIEVNEPIEEEIDTSDIFIDETDPALMKFVTSDELNELRDILIELPDDIHLLLLDNKAIVIARVDEQNETYLYCLGDDEEELSLIKMPMRLEEILANNQIIQYTPANISDVHDKVVELFAKELEPDEEQEEEWDDAEKAYLDDEPMEDLEEEIPEPDEGVDEDEEDKINS